MKINLHENITAYLQEQNIIQNYPSSEYGVVCESEHDIAAYLYYSKNQYHPDALYLRFAIFDRDLESDTLIKMYDKFKKVLPSSNIILQVHRNFEMYESFISANDFVEFRKTYEPEVDIHNMVSRSNAVKNNGRNNDREFTLTEELLDEIKNVYEEAHKDNPVIDMGLSEWEDIIDDDLDMKNSIVIYDHPDEIAGFMLIYDSGETSKDVGDCYFRNHEGKQNLTAEFYNKLRSLQEEGYKQINLEVDSTDKYAYEFFHEVIKDEEPSLISFIKHASGNNLK